MGPLPERVPVVLVGLEIVTVVLEVVVVELELEVVVVELDVVVVCDDPPEEPTEPVTEMIGVPVGREPLDEGTVTTTVPLPVLTTGVPGLPEPEPEPPWPSEPEPPDAGGVGVAETGAGVLTTGTVTVVAPPPEPPLPEPLVPPPELPPPVPFLGGAELGVGRLPATGCEMVAEVECRAER
jgi:hypothetical protein